MEDYLSYLIRAALDEDIASGDITTSAVISADKIAKGHFLVKAAGIIAGLNVAEKVFHLLDSRLKFKWILSDGTAVNPGDVAAEVEGSAGSILTAERTALNFLQRMSGIATLTNQFVKKIKHTDAKILDTRKTAPCLRFLDKEAVRIGGGMNHRMGLFDLYLIKDNHIEAAGSITKAVELCRQQNENMKSTFNIEIETRNLAEVKEALSCKVDIIMLDNFTIEMMREAVALINKKCQVEASGNINLSNVAGVAETGVDYISIGALTHSVAALDISLELELT